MTLQHLRAEHRGETSAGHGRNKQERGQRLLRERLRSQGTRSPDVSRWSCLYRAPDSAQRLAKAEPGSLDQAQTSVCAPFFAAPSDRLRQLEAYSKSPKNSECRSAVNELSPLHCNYFEVKKRPKRKCGEGRFTLYFITDTATYFFWMVPMKSIRENPYDIETGPLRAGVFIWGPVVSYSLKRHLPSTTGGPSALSLRAGRHPE